METGDRIMFVWEGDDAVDGVAVEYTARPEHSLSSITFRRSLNRTCRPLARHASTIPPKCRCCSN